MFAKICGITRTADALHAVKSGATALGFVFWPGSPRCLEAEDAREIVAALPWAVTTVGVFVNESADIIRHTVTVAGLNAVQLHGDEPPAVAEALSWPVFKAVTLAGAEQASRDWSTSTTFILDAHDPVRRGGTGIAVDWQRAAGIARTRRLVLAGGLTPANVGEAIKEVRPFGVDVSSGVESAPGIKDPDKVTQFLSNARAAFENGKGHARGNY
jgi:phosphoribosylanthranilate isomerase